MADNPKPIVRSKYGICGHNITYMDDERFSYICDRCDQEVCYYSGRRIMISQIGKEQVCKIYSEKCGKGLENKLP